MSGFVALLRTDGQDAAGALISRLAEDMAYRGPSRRAVLAQGAFAAGISIAAPASAVLDQHEGTTIAGTIRLHARTDLVRRLAAAGIRTQAGMPDGALVLRAYAAWGTACVERLLGDFAFALWDAKALRLLAATDRFGTRPIYYAQTAQGLLVGNSIGTMLASGWIAKTLDEKAIADYLVLGLNSDPAGTIYTQIRSLPSAHCLLANASGTRTQGYWSPLIQDGYRFHRSEDDYADELLAVLKEAVADRLPAEGPIHLTLSGGMDSGSIAGAIYSLLGPKETQARLKAHTIVYRSMMQEEEGRYANLVGAHLGISPQILTAEISFSGTRMSEIPGSLRSLRPCISSLRNMRSPNARWPTPGMSSPVSAAILCSSLHSPTVFDLLSREGLAAPITMARHILHHRKLPPLGLRRAAGQRLRRVPEPELPLWINADFARRTDMIARVSAFRDDVRRKSPHVTMPGPFWKTDPGQLGLPIESFYPFFDSRLMDFLLRVPAPLLRKKSLLRRAMRNLLPPEVLRRPKTALGLSSLPNRRQPQTQARQRRIVANAPMLADYANIAVLRRCIDQPQTGTSAPLFFAEQFAFWLSTATTGSVRNASDRK
ncbi:MAG: asparagine synthase-related protein [Rhizomicrobium sp.]